mmetsp:Transcript_73263/g.212192  ORF Transcript_73263/g.212192 Transcript_73263/m.212192 type:complete len:246 (+) Transcript_73263:906-1643(+)
MLVHILALPCNVVESYLQRTRVLNGNSRPRLAKLGSLGLDLAYNIHTRGDLTEDSVFTVQPRSIGSADKELRSIGVGSSISHRQSSWASMSNVKVFIGKCAPIDTLSTGAVSIREVTSLAHESRNYTVEGRTLVPESWFPSAKLLEVFGRLGDSRAIEPHLNTTSSFSVNGNVKVNSVRNFGIRLSEQSLEQPSDHIQLRRWGDLGGRRSHNRREGLSQCRQIRDDKERSNGNHIDVVVGLSGMQ